MNGEQMADDQPATEFTRDAILKAARDGSLETLCRQAGLDLEEPDWQLFVDAVIEMQRGEEIDLLAAVTGSEGHIDYYAERLYQAALPELNLPVSVMLDAATAL